MNPSNSLSKNQRIVQALLDWFSKNARDLPWRRSRDPYAIWVSEIMLQQTQVKTVIPFWERWMKNLPTIKSLARAKPEKVLKLWEGLGYYTRARNLQKAAQEISSNHDGKFPRDFDAILALPGIGRYTAGAIASIAFNDPKPILDGNVIRVLTRIFGIETNPREKETNAELWKIAADLVNRATELEPRFAFHVSRLTQSVSHFNQSLMELGALVCTPRQPRCPACPLQKQCVALRENQIESLPTLTKRPEPTKRHFIAFVVEKNGRYFIQQRPREVVNARLWEFPNYEVSDGKNLSTNIPFGFALSNRLCTIQHSITRYRITLDVFRAKSNSLNNLDGRWLGLAELRKLAFSSAHRRILDRLASETNKKSAKVIPHQRVQPFR